jgi:predicted alpha/beta superfamily hydrolase
MLIRTVAIILSISISATCAASDAINQFIFTSTINNHSYLISTTQPRDSVSNDSNLHLLIYLDANLKSGQIMKDAISQKAQYKAQGQIIGLGITHLEPFHLARRRDFIPPSENTKNDSNFGNADIFYRILIEELLPLIKNRYSYTFKSTSLVGHSLGGAFAVYAFLRPNSPFQFITAFSPSLWVQNKSLLRDFEQLDSGSTNTVSLTISYGGLELFNKIRKNAVKLERLVKTQQIRHISIEKIPRKFHNNYLKKASMKLLKAKQYRGS